MHQTSLSSCFPLRIAAVEHCTSPLPPLNHTTTLPVSRRDSFCSLSMQRIQSGIMTYLQLLFILEGTIE